MIVCGLLACAPSEQVGGSEGTGKEAPTRLSSTDLRIAATVDTSLAVDQEAIACLRRFFVQKLDTAASNDYWYPGDLEEYGGLYSEILYAEFDSVGDLRYPPVLIAITEEEGQRLLTVEWRRKDGADAHADPHLGFTFLVKQSPEGVRLALPLEHYTRNWSRQQVGTVTYIVSPEHRFDPEKAREQQRMIDRLAAFFEVPVFPIRYFSYAGPLDLFTTKGFTHHPLMHAHSSGGMVDGIRNLHAGNGKDIYVHEVVHLYSHRRTADTPPLLEEGLATLIGGSVERDYAWHRANMARYLVADTALDLRDRCNTYARDDIFTDTSVPYMIGALLCEHLLRTEGKEGLFQVMDAGADPWPALAQRNITPAGLTDLLRAELKKPAVSVP